MLTILEGCDGVGKSTLANRLRDRLIAQGGHVTMLHAGPIDTDVLTAYELSLYDYDPTDGDRNHVICDRHHLGELIYGPILRGETRMSRAERIHIDLFLRSRGAIVLHLTAPLRTIHDRLEDRGDDLIEHDHVERIIDTYYRVTTDMHWATPTYHLHDSNEGRSSNDVDSIIAVSKGHAAVAAAFTWRFTTYIGPPRPNYLILGERRKEILGSSHTPAFVPFASTSGRYLLDAVPSDCLTSVGIANACEEDLSELWPILGYPKIVTLGRAADRECTLAEIPHGAVPHPQYIRRFHHKRKLEYGRAIREALIYGKGLSHAFSHPSIRSA